MRNTHTHTVVYILIRIGLARRFWRWIILYEHFKRAVHHIRTVTDRSLYAVRIKIILSFRWCVTVKIVVYTHAYKLVPHNTQHEVIVTFTHTHPHIRVLWRTIRGKTFALLLYRSLAIK